MSIRLTKTYIERLCFEKKLKTYLIRQAMESEKSRDHYHYLNYRGREALRQKLGSFEPMTKQLILRSHIGDLINVLLEQNNPVDALYLAEVGTRIDCLYHADDEIFKQTIPVLLKRTDELPHEICRLIVKNTEDLDALYLQVKDTHKEMLPRMITTIKCSADLFATIINMKLDNKDFPFETGMENTLAQHMLSGKIKVIRTPSLIKEEK